MGRSDEGEYFSGQIADVRIYDAALNDPDIDVLAGRSSYYSNSDYNRLESDSTYDYEYDNEGNLTRRTKRLDDSYTIYTWDYRNRLVSVSDYDEGDTLLDKTTYVYDAFDRRIGKHFDTDGDDDIDRDEFYVYDGSDIVLDFVDPRGKRRRNAGADDAVSVGTGRGSASGAGDV